MSSDSPQQVATRNGVAARAVRKVLLCLLALSFLTLSTWMLNRYLFPIYDIYLITLRDISNLITGAVFIAFALIASRTSAPFVSRWFPICAIASSALAAAAFLAGASLESAPLVISGAILGAIGSGLFFVMMCTAFFDLGLKTIAVIVVLSTLLAYLLRIPVEAVGTSVAVPLTVLLRIAIPVILLPDSAAGFASITQAGSVQDARLAKPGSFLPFGSHIFICILVFQIVFGIALTYDEVARVPVATGFEIIPLSLVACYICIQAARKRDFDPDLLFRIAFLLIVAGFLIIPISSSMPSGLANMLLYAGSDVFGIVSWYVIIAIALRNRLGAISTFSWGTAMKSIGVVIGAWLGRQLNTGGIMGVSKEVVVAAIILLFVAYAIYFVSHERFAATIESIAPVEKVVVTAPADEAQTAPKAEDEQASFHDRCQKIATRYDLTPREEDVFELLARGRNGHYIQENLVVSYNTVKTHVFHVYNKLGVHTQQEIIDLAEADPDEDMRSALGARGRVATSRDATSRDGKTV